ncbi:MAG: serine/threonine-protein kinase HipA [Myxococcota bacterium]|jgi:serine/threonine-protein kinase HipA
MMLLRCTIELFRDGSWVPAAEVRLFGGGRRDDETFLEYVGDYPVEHFGESGAGAVSMRYPVSFALYEPGHLPAFCVDLMPQGEAWRRRERQLQAAGLPITDWNILTHGAGNPVGNLRVAEAVSPEVSPGPGVSRDEIVLRGDGFRDWAEQNNIPMRGASDSGGAAPKLLLVADAGGSFHADGALPDARAARHYIVKFPRGRRQRDAQVLANEAPYLEVLRALGLRCGAPLVHEDGALFVPRFDRRVADGGVERWGMESLYALSGVVEAGARLSMVDACAGLAAVVDEPHADIIEFILRDAAALAMGNPDNHGRNHAVLKPPGGGVCLSPVFDFSPMFLDGDGIRRALRWPGEQGTHIDWSVVCTLLAPLVPGSLLRPALRSFGERLASLPALMADCGVEAALIEHRARAIDTVSRDLLAVDGG